MATAGQRGHSHNMFQLWVVVFFFYGLHPILPLGLFAFVLRIHVPILVETER